MYALCFNNVIISVIDIACVISFNTESISKTRWQDIGIIYLSS
jgi:hypothetical protein